MIGILFDLAYIAMHDDLDEIKAFDKTVSSIIFYDGTAQTIQLDQE